MNTPTEVLEDQLVRAEKAVEAGNFDEAERLSLGVLEIFETMKSPAGDTLTFDKEIQAQELKIEGYLLVRVFLTLGIVANRRGNYPLALDRYAAAQAKSEALDYRKGIAGTMQGFGNVYANLSEYDKALEYYHKALSVNEELSNTPGIASSLGGIGTVYARISDSVQAMEYYHRALAIDEEAGNKSGIAINLGNLGTVYKSLSEYTKALECFRKSLAMKEEIGNKSGLAVNLGNIGSVYYDLSDYAQALEYYQKSLALSEEQGSKPGIAIDLGNIGNVYSHLSDYGHALEYYQRALAIYEEIGSKSGIAHILGSIGNVYHNIADYSQAIVYIKKSLKINEELGDKSGIGHNLGVIGSVYWHLSDYANALEYMQKSLAIGEEIGNKKFITENLGNIGETYAKKEFEGYNPALAEEYLHKALAISEEIGSRNSSCFLHKYLVTLYENEHRLEEAFEHFKKFYALEKEVQNEEAKKQAGLMEQRKQAAEHEKYLAVERAEAATTRRILHNTLPPVIADRLINNETFIADQYEEVSVLFMDLVNFTVITGIVPPRHLIYLLNSIFSTADAVMQKHGLEKIKTIGDAYMAVSGAPIANANHAVYAAAASLDLLEAMNNLRIVIPEELGDRSWVATVGDIQVRIGLHCGSAIGGVIGDKKFSFDLWGDAVNTASRMESHGEPGKIHVSEVFKQALQKDPCLSQESPMSLHFQERGEIDIKGKGRMTTYFLESTLRRQV